MTMHALSSLLLLWPFQGEQPASLVVEQPALFLQAKPAWYPLTIYNLSLLGIGRTVDDAEPVDEHLGLGLEFDVYDVRGVLGWEVGGSWTTEETSEGGVELDSRIVEIYSGARKTWGSRDLRPYAGAGVSYVEGKFDDPVEGSQKDNSWGMYGHGGAYWTVGEHLNLGVDLRALVFTDFEFGDANYFQAAVVLGYSF